MILNVLSTYLLSLYHTWAYQVAQWQRIHLPSRRCGFDPRNRKIPWKNKWQPTPEFLRGESHGQISLVGYSPWGCKTVGHNLVTKQQMSTITNVVLNKYTNIVLNNYCN